MTSKFRSTTFFILVLATSTRMQGQIPFGPRGGGGMLTLERGLDTNYPVASKGSGYLGFLGHGGLFLGGPVKRAISFRSELTFKFRRQTYDFQEISRYGNTAAQVISMQIPALFEYRSKGGVRAIVGAGMEFPLAASAVAVLASTTSGPSNSLNTNIKKDMKGMLMSFIFDIGYGLSNGVTLGIRSDLGLSNIWKKDSSNRDLMIADHSFTIEYDINFRRRQLKMKP